MTLLFLILLIFKVHWYSIWLALFVDALLCGFYFAYKSDDVDFHRFNTYFAYVLFGIALFSFYKFFCGFTISPWFILLAPIYLFVCCFVPGGFLIGYQLFVSNGLLTHKVWVFVLTIILTLVSLAVPISTVKDLIDDHKKRF